MREKGRTDQRNHRKNVRERKNRLKGPSEEHERKEEQTEGTIRNNKRERKNRLIGPQEEQEKKEEQNIWTIGTQTQKLYLTRIVV